MDALPALDSEFVAQFAGAPFERRVSPVGENFGQRGENEETLVEARVGEGEFGRLQGEVTVKKEVEVEGTVLVAGDLRVAAAVVASFDGQEEAEQGERVQRGFEEANGVDEVVVGLHVQRGAEVGGGEAQGVDAGRGVEFAPCGEESGFAVALVRAEADGGMHPFPTPAILRCFCSHFNSISLRATCHDFNGNITL